MPFLAITSFQRDFEEGRYGDVCVCVFVGGGGGGGGARWSVAMVFFSRNCDAHWRTDCLRQLVPIYNSLDQNGGK